MTAVTTLNGDRVRLDRGAVDDFATSLLGELVRPADSMYEQHRTTWNGSIDRRPALIARCAGVADVIAAVRFARKHGLLVAVRGGGHSFPGYSVCDGGLVIDLSQMKRIRVDPAARTARAQAGVLLGELDRQAQEFGLAVPSGIVTHTGLSGLTLGGGIGMLMRKYGLTVDNLLSADVITADGEFVRASEKENSDLFWGLRGGGGNFGIVTEFEFRLREVGPIVIAGPVFWPMVDSPKVLRFYRDWIAEAPDELMTIVVHRKAPALPFVPQELRGQPVVSVVCCYCGSVDDGKNVVRPLKDFGSPVLDLCEPKRFVEQQGMFDVSDLTDEIIDITIDHSSQIKSPLTAFPIWQRGGAVARVGEDETAFAGRKAGYTFNITAMTETTEGFAEEREWVRNFWLALEPHHTGVYVNFLMDEGEERIRRAYGVEKYERLKTLKNKYDAQNFFRLNQNIPPA
jgi:FAD binding domain/Berberine and berberine like